MKKNIFGLIVVIIVAAVAYLVVTFISVKLAVVSTTTDTGKNDWLVYRNNQYVFTIQYPSNWSINNGPSQRHDVGTFFVGAGESIVTFSLPADAYPKTNYFDGFVTVAVTNLGQTQASCQLAQQAGNTSQISLLGPQVINGLNFYYGQVNDAAAGTFAKTLIYHTFTNAKCYEITLNLFKGNIDNYPVGTVTPIDDSVVLKRLQQVMETFNFQ